MRASASRLASPGVTEVIQQQLDPLQRAGSVSGHPRGVGGGLEQQPHDPKTRPLPLPGNDFSTHRGFETGRAQAPQPGRVTAGAGKDDAHPGEPGPGAERLLGRVQRRRPHALQQVTDLLDLADRLSEQPFAAGPQVPQPAPGLIQWFWDVAAQLRGQPRNEDSVFLIGLVEGQVLAAPRPRSQQGLHTDERHPAVGCQLAEHPPAVPGRLTRHAHPGEAGLTRVLARPVQRQPKIPRPTAERPPSKDLRIMVGHYHHLLAIGQIDPHDRVRHRHQLAKPIQSCVPIAVTPGDSITVAH